jgi:HKD family nuclease
MAATWPENELLPAIREVLAEADAALLCVAFANRRGINLLQPQLARLGSRCRLMVTSAFGGQTTGSALAAAADLGVRVRVLNPSGGTFHPKLYLARGPRRTVAAVGSANLTSGLMVNIESALVLTGADGDEAIADCWQLAERLWEHPAARDWTAVRESLPEDQFDQDLLSLLRSAVPVGSVIATLAEGRSNVVVDITEHGVYVETSRSRTRQTGAQLVPAWMLQLAWDYLTRYGQLSNRYLLADDGLNVKRSSAVCALLAELPGVEIASRRPIVLRLVP